MSNYRQSNGDDFPDASKKHVEDSQKLLEAKRFDGAGYLAGYAIECVMKTIALVEGLSLRGHNLNTFSASTQLLLSSPSSKTAKYIKNPTITNVSFGTGPNEWNSSIRYFSEGRVSEPVANNWVSEAKRLYLEVINQMILDGVITK